MERFAKQLVSKMEQYHLISTDQMEGYIYVLQSKMENIISILCLIILSYLFDTVMPTIIFLIAISALKKWCGGIHANTFLKCLGSTITIYIVFVKCFIPVMLKNIRIAVFVYLAAFVIIEIIGTFNHPNMHWNRKEYKKAKELVRITAFIELFITMILLVLNADLTSIVFLMFAMVLSSILLLLAKVFEKEVHL